MDNLIKEAVKVMKTGGVIICPSESCYSFSCDAKNEEAVKRIHKIKQENSDKPIILIVSDLKQIEEIGVLNETAVKLAEKLMPCQLNLIIKKKQGYDFLSKDTIAFRIPANKIMFDLAHEMGSAITTTSVNITGQEPIYEISKAKELFGGKVDFVIDSGNLNSKIPVSTIYDTINKKILRQGLITEKEINQALL